MSPLKTLAADKTSPAMGSMQSHMRLRRPTDRTLLNSILCHRTPETLLPRRIEKIETYYSSLGIDVLFKHIPKLQQHMRAKYDDDLVTEVQLLTPEIQNQGTDADCSRFRMLKEACVQCTPPT